MTVRYAVDLTDRLHHLVRVSLTVPAAHADGARIVLPVWTPGSYVVRDYVHHVQWIRARDAEGTEVVLEPDGHTAWRLPAGARGEHTVELELYANELTVRTNHVDDHHALLIPAATFPYVEGAEDEPHEVHLPPAPAGHRVWSLLPAGERPDTYVAEHRDHLVDSAFEVGDLPAVEFEVAGVTHDFVWAGHGGHPDLAAIARDAAAIGEAAVALFDGELPVAHYRYLCTGWHEGGGGLEHREGSVLQMPIRTFQEPDLLARFQSLVAHEYLHLWNVKRLVPTALVRPDYERPTHTESLWVAEGWTAYYDELLPLRAGVWTLTRFLDNLRDTWQRVLDTPGVALQSLRRAGHEAWVKHYVRDENTVNANTDYYGHGSLVAWYLDLLLRELRPDGDGLDEVFRLLWQRHANTAEGYTEADVERAVSDVAGTDLGAVFDAHVAGTALPPVEEVLPAVGLRVVATGGDEVPDLGAQVSEDDHAVTLASVLRGRPAWQAGLTGGDQLVAVDGTRVRRGELPGQLRARRAGDEVDMTVLRGPRLLTRRVTLGAPRPGRRLVRDEHAADAQRDAFRRWTGVAWESAPTG
ncbi:M61 family metallopeptidase [Egicoccus halophilus]|uniref:Peptidase M61 n=1 Tax=Egicoccus halophilus TaxID=1670830 RepID=A0A8J3AH64_9ACTN|nr:PDZ domain-containing protein [Egicoccus halophilus]GGI09114.1 peptidase M61 [Egicoccus halophilus]